MWVGRRQLRGEARAQPIGMPDEIIDKIHTLQQTISLGKIVNEAGQHQVSGRDCALAGAKVKQLTTQDGTAYRQLRTT